MNEKTKFANLSDNFLLSISIFVLNILLVGYIIHSKIVAIIISGINASIISYFIIKKYKTSTESINNLKQNKKLAELTLKEFKMSHPKNLDNFFKIVKNKISTKNKDSNIKIFYDFYCDSLTLNDLTQKIKNTTKNQQIYYFSTSFNNDCFEYVKKHQNIKLYNYEQSYEFLKSIQVFPKIHTTTQPKLTFEYIKTKLSSIKFTKASIKLALILFLFSFFVKFNSFYKLFSFIFVTFAICSILLRKQLNHKNVFIQ